MHTSDTMEEMTQVEPKRTYTATDIAREGLIPWARDAKTIAKILASGVIETEVTGESTQKRYSVKGSKLKKYLKQYGPALMHTARKPKSYGKESRSNDRAQN